MPRDDNSRRGLAGLMGRVNQTMDSLYTSTYYTRPNNAKALDQLRDKIDQNLDRIVNANMDTMGIPSVSKVYSRLKIDLDRQDASNKGKATVEDYFNDALNYFNVDRRQYDGNNDGFIDAVFAIYDVNNYNNNSSSNNKNLWAYTYHSYIFQ